MGKIGGRVNFLYRKQPFLTSTLRSLLCSTHFDYACTTWHATLNKNILNKIQTIHKNIYIRFCLNIEIELI